MKTTELLAARARITLLARGEDDRTVPCRSGLNGNSARIWAKGLCLNRRKGCARQYSGRKVNRCQDNRSSHLFIRAPVQIFGCKEM